MKLGITFRSKKQSQTRSNGVSRAPRAWVLGHARLRLLGVGGVACLAAGAGHEPSVAHAQVVEQARGSVALDARTEDGGSQSLPLVDERVAVRIEDGHATAVYDHVFQNESKGQLEGNYRLMVGEGATATGFAYWNGEAKIVGEIFEREAAREVYEAMTGLRRDPGLLEQAGEGGFSFRVFPIAPGEKKHVQVTTSRWVPLRNGALEYRLRLASHGAVVTLDVRDARGLASVESPTHEVSLETSTTTTTSAAPATPAKPENGEDHRRVRVGKAKAGVAGAESELVLRITPKAPPLTLQAVTHRDRDVDGFVGVSLRTAPRAKSATRVPHDVTLVLDRSGSMSGGSMEAARSAARKVVARLGETDAVNVIAFDDKVETLFPKPQLLTDQVRREVDGYLGKLQTRGGTEIAKALSAALGAQTKDERPDLVVFLTDGQSDGPSAIEVAAKDTSDTRVFTVGMGDGVDKALLSRIASMKKGRFAFVADARAVETELPKIVAQLEPAVLTDLRIRAEGATLAKVYPSTLPDLFADDELRVFARTKHASGGTGKVIVEAKENGVPRVFEATFDDAAVAKPFVARSWARARVDDLLEETKSSGDAEKQKGFDDEVVELGLAYGLVTPRTSFLAIPESEMTKAAKDATESMRERKKKILLANKDAAALSRLNMPPGDPILRVRAPRDAKRVTASFPFGLSIDLAFDTFTEEWATRFLVPKDVADGSYEVPVVIVHRDDHVEVTSVRYTIDAAEPAFEVDVRPEQRLEGAGVLLRVRVDEAALEVRAQRVGVSPSNVVLTKGAEQGTFVGFVPLPPGVHQLRVVVADVARNESDRTVEVSR